LGKKRNFNTLIDPDLSQTEDDIPACYEFMETICMQFLLDFFFCIRGREAYERLLYKAQIITQSNLLIRVCYSKSSLGMQQLI